MRLLLILPDLSAPLAGTILSVLSLLKVPKCKPKKTQETHLFMEGNNSCARLHKHLQYDQETCLGALLWRVG